MTGDIRIAFDELSGLIAAVFRRHGCSDHVAGIIAANMAAAERDGAESHGLFRIPGYLGSLDSGWVDGVAEPMVKDVAPGMVRVDARNGFAQPALLAGRALLVEKARANGIAVIAIRNSHHFGALWPDVEPFAREGFVALSVVNSMASVAPADGHTAVFGTNPIAFAAPRHGDEPLVFDQASSALSNGDVQIAAREGRRLPEGAGIDRKGQPTTDPRAVLDGGALLPFGGYKGGSLALMVEILCAGLAGGNFSFEVDWSRHPGAATPKTGQTLILIDPMCGAERDFGSRVSHLLDAARQAGQSRLPGDRRYRQRAEAMARGIGLAPDALAALQAAAR